MARRISFLSVFTRRAVAARPEFCPLSTDIAAKAILSGTLNAAGQSLYLPQGTHPWTQTLPSEPFAASLHSFDWLRELAASKDPVAGARARQLTDDWASVYSDWNIFAYRRGLLARQIARLKKDYKSLPEGEDRLLATTTLALAGAMLPDEALLDRNLDRLDDALEKQIFGDGGHISRRPASGAYVLQALLTVEDALKIRGIAGSKQTRRAIDRLAPALGFFDPGDGSLASFNGSGEMPAARLKALLKKTGVKPAKTFSYMPHTGYQRLERAGTVVIADAGDSPPIGNDARAHLAPLAFELSTRGKRLVINCGYNDNQPPNWRNVVRETAAHSALIIDDCSAGEITTAGPAQKAFGTAISRNAGPTTSSRMEEGDDVWLDAAHEGYRRTTGLDHRRRIFLTGDDQASLNVVSNWLYPEKPSLIITARINPIAYAGVLSASAQKEVRNSARH